MMRKSWTKWLMAAVVMMAAVASCGVSSRSTSDLSSRSSLLVPRSSLTSEESLRYNYFFFEAMNQQNAGHYDAAFDLLNRCLDINPNAAEAWFYLSMYQGEFGHDSLALASMEKAARLRPDNATYQEQLAQHYLNARQYDKATAVYEQLAENFRQRSDVLQMLIRLYQQNKNYDGMIDVINRIEEIEGANEEITLSKMRVYEMKGDKKAAWNALKALSDKHPSDLNYRVMMGNWLMQNNRQKEAYKIFADALKEEPDNGYVQASMYDYYRESGQDSLARKMMLDIIVSPKASTESKAIMMRQAIQENEQLGGDSTAILALYDKILQVNPKDSDMAEMRVAYMTLKQMPTDSINGAIRQLLAIAPENAGARLQLLGSYLRSKDWDSVISICSEGSRYTPEEMAFYYYEGLAYYQKEEHEEALGSFQRGVAQVKENSNKELVSDLYYFMGDLYHQKGQENKAFVCYDSCLQWKDDHVPCLNNYAYYLSVKGQDLHRAELMSYKTVKEEPQNATYLDTYAWILFMQERYAEAKIYIDQAVACDTDSVQSSVIIEHAGDIYYKNGEPETAISYWEKALEGEPENRDLLERKIREKKYIKEEEK